MKEVMRQMKIFRVLVLIALTACAAPRAELDRPSVQMPQRLQPVGSSASSQESEDNRPDKAFDGDAKSRWASAQTDGQWVSADLGSDRTIVGVRLVWEDAFGEEYRIEGSVNNEDWARIVTVRNGDGQEDRLDFSPVKARYIRMYGVHRGTQYGFSLYEFEIWGF